MKENAVIKHVLAITLMLVAGTARADKIDSMAFNPITGQVNAVTHQNGTKPIVVLDKIGSFTVPTQPVASYVISGSDYQVCTGTADCSGVIKASSAIVDQTNNYSTSTGLFTCPGKGVYLVQGSVNWFISPNPVTSPEAILFIQKNGTNIVVYTCDYYANPTSRHQCTALTAITCSAGDTLAFFLGTNIGTGGSTRTLFASGGTETSLSFIKLF